VDSLIAYEDSYKSIPGKKYGYPYFFITSRGGEYYFVPPISTLSDWAKGDEIEPSLWVLGVAPLS